MKAESSYEDVTSKKQKKPQAFLGIINYLGKFSPSTAGMWITKTADTKQNRMDLKCNIPEIICQGKMNNNRRCMYEILWWNPASVPGDRSI